jgi:iron(III) transport system substrate-binding protein
MNGTPGLRERGIAMSTPEPRIGARRARLRLYGAKALLPLALVSLLVACGNPGQMRVAETDENVEKVAHYTGNDRQEFLEKGAREEGKLTLFSSTGNPAITEMVTAFEKKYPFVDVSIPCCVNSPADVTTRAVAEFQSGRGEIGVIETFVSGVNALRERGMLTTFATPNASLQIDSATDPDGYYVATRSNQRGLAVNTDRIPLAEAPKAWKDLLDPKWKGRISVAGGEAATRLVAYYEDTQDDSYLEKFAKQDPQLIEVTTRALADMLISGEVELSPTITRAHVLGPISKGAPVAFIPIEPVDSISTAIALPKDSPSPHAATLLIDFMTSAEGQQIYVDNGFDSLAPDLMKPQDRETELIFLDSRPAFLDRSDELADRVATLFR